MFQNLAFAALAFFAGAATAQQVTRPSPADARATVPLPRYESPFAGYRSYAEPEVARWREVNDEMGRLGGHVGHLPQAAPQQKPAPKPAAESGHGAHK